MTRAVLLILAALLVQGSDAATPDQREAFERWRDQRQQDFASFRAERDAEFAGYLEEAWQAFESFQQGSDDGTPKPVEVPTAPEPTRRPPSEPPRRLEPPVDATDPVLEPVPQPVLPVRPEPVAPTVPQVSFRYFGAEVSLPEPGEGDWQRGFELRSRAIANAWSEVGSAVDDALLDALAAQRSSLGLDDWGSLLLIQAYADAAVAQRDAATLLAWYLLVHSGLDVHGARDDRRLLLLVPSTHRMFDLPYLTLDDQRYYISPHAPERIADRRSDFHTHESRFPGEVRPVSTVMAAPAGLPPRPQQRALSFRFGAEQHELSVAYDLNRVEYLDALPQFGIERYFRAPPDPVLVEGLLPQVSALLAGRAAEDGVNLLLRMLQQGLAYQTDAQQFGRENYLLPAETLHYPYADCEDRAVLFAWVARSLLQLEVVGLDYPGHIAAAVASDAPAQAGGSFLLGPQRYVVADPTYINADAGMVMPDFAHADPQPIEVR